MPEIAEVARAVHYLRKHLVGKTLKKVTALEDNNVFGKVGTSHTEIMKQLTGKKVVDAGQQGKYFWMIMSSPPHPVMHFGMSGWLRFKSEHTYYYRKTDDEDDSWPPRFWRVMFETDGKGEDKIEAAFCDSRRFGRFRLVDCPGKDIRQHSPLVENGPDPVQDKDEVTVEWLKALCNKKKVPIKAMLLDQANISGIGNWVGDEIMYNAKMHPEQYANTLTDEEVAKLHKSIHFICQTAVDLLADSEEFPEDWLFKHRWGKGKKDASKTLPSGEKIVFLTVGGRTSAVIPSVQKKTGPVAKEISGAEDEEKPKKGKAKKQKVEDDSTSEAEAAPAKPAKGRKRVKEENIDDDAANSAPILKKRKGRNQKGETIATETNGDITEEEEKATTRKAKRQTKAKTDDAAKPVVTKKPNAKSNQKPEASEGRRRSGRLRK